MTSDRWVHDPSPKRALGLCDPPYNEVLEENNKSRVQSYCSQSKNPGNYAREPATQTYKENMWNYTREPVSGW